FWNDLAADRTRSIPEADRQTYTAAYARPGRMRAAWAYFVSFQQAATDFAQLSQTKLPMPVLSIAGGKSMGDVLGKQAALVASNAMSIVVPGAGHWLLEERAQETTEALRDLLTAGAAATQTTPAFVDGQQM